jgi:tryptophan-rich sensory protein
MTPAVRPYGRVQPRSALHQLAALALFLVLSLMVEGIVSLVAQPGLADPAYAGLAKPDWTPPAAVFPWVWTALYLLIGLAAWLAWRRAPAGCFGWPFAAFAVQLAINGAWPWVFFGQVELLAALVLIGALILAIVANLLAFRPYSGWAALALLPYLAWTGYAAAVTFEIWRLNGGV